MSPNQFPVKSGAEGRGDIGFDLVFCRKMSSIPANLAKSGHICWFLSNFFCKINPYLFLRCFSRLGGGPESKILAELNFGYLLSFP